MPARQARLVGMGTSRLRSPRSSSWWPRWPSPCGARSPRLRWQHPPWWSPRPPSLHNDRVVKVIGSGFKPHDHVFLVECLASATGQSQCDINTATPATITAKGVLPRTKFTVVSGKVGTGHCGTALSNLKACVINAGNANGGDTASTPITFAPPKRAR